MEPAEAKVEKRPLRTVWSFQTSVKQIFNRGPVDAPEFWVQLEGSRESLYFGEDPGWKVGDKVKVTMEKI